MRPKPRQVSHAPSGELNEKLFGTGAVNSMSQCAQCSCEENFSVGPFAINEVSGRQNGLVIGIFNRTRDLHGVQIGLLNYAENAAFPWLPFVNAKF